MCDNMRGVCVDFDGVLNNYEYYDDDDLSTPRAGAKEFLESLSKRFYVIIFTARDNSKVEKWLNDHDMPYNEVTNIKKPAVAYIDDRALQFNGDYKAILNVIESFEPYYLKPEQGYDKSYRDYLQMKIDTYDKHNEVINDVKDWFETYQPQITLKSVYLNPRPMIDQLCLVLHEKLPAKVINSFCNDFMLDLSSEWYQIRREHGRTAIVGNPYVDFEEWRYSFKVRI